MKRSTTGFEGLVSEIVSNKINSKLSLTQKFHNLVRSQKEQTMVRAAAKAERAPLTLRNEVLTPIMNVQIDSAKRRARSPRHTR